MEVLTPQDHRQHISHSADWYRHRYGSGLPTPKSTTSQLSSDGLDRTRAWPIDLTPPSDMDKPRTAHSRVPSASHSRQGSQAATALPSIPSTRPSLPSLREILNQPLASPPSTPIASGRSLHFQSPTHDSHYRYGHKRECSGLTYDRHQSRQNSPTARPALTLPPRRDSAALPPVDLSGYRQSKDPLPPRHRSGSAFLPELRIPAYDSRTVSPDRGPVMPATAVPHARKRSYDSMDDRAPPAPAWLTAQPHYAQVPRSALLPPSEPMYRSYPGANPHMHRRHESYDTRLAPSYHHASHDPRHMVEVDYHRPAGYEYQLSKSRKRSNLPKESTDIMKRWFEEHLDNPYPSEDDKKYFAQKAGINLTQVSNWFINHRRRCPELREQRDKKQGGAVGARQDDDTHSP